MFIRSSAHAITDKVRLHYHGRPLSCQAVRSSTFDSARQIGQNWGYPESFCHLPAAIKTLAHSPLDAGKYDAVLGELFPHVFVSSFYLSARNRVAAEHSCNINLFCHLPAATKTLAHSPLDAGLNRLALSFQPAFKCNHQRDATFSLAS